jgi:hypothetical protein
MALLLTQPDYETLAAQVIAGVRNGKVITEKTITRLLGTAGVQVTLTYADGGVETLRFAEDVDTHPFGA